MSPPGRLIAAVAIYGALVVYSYAPFAYHPRGGALTTVYVLLAAAAVTGIGYISRSYLILLLPALLTIVFAIVNHGRGSQTGFALLITVVILLPANEVLLALGVYIARRAGV